jgi:hypothetical protein
MMTYLNIVNNVLRRLREEEVSSVQSTTYSKMIGDFVNDAKSMVEEAWDWSALRTTLTVETTKDIFNYAMTGAGNSFKILHAYNDTDNWDMEYRTPIWFDHRYMMQEPVSGPPRYYTFNGVDADGDTQIDLYPKPSEYGTILRFNVVNRGEITDGVGDVVRPKLLENDTDKVLIPYLPVLHLSVALASRERGETGGTSTPEYFAMADKYLSDAIALDAQKHPEETIWYTP